MMAKFFKVESIAVEPAKRGSRERYPFSQLKVGQSFSITVPVLKEHRLKLVRSMRAAITNAHRRQPESRYGLNTSGKRYRIGRLS